MSVWGDSITFHFFENGSLTTRPMSHPTKADSTDAATRPMRRPSEFEGSAASEFDGTRVSSPSKVTTWSSRTREEELTGPFHQFHGGYWWLLF